MTVSAQTPAIEYVENGSTTAFAVPFRYDDPSHLRADRVAAGGAVTALVNGTDFTSTSGASDAGGTLTVTAAAVSGTQLRIWRETPRTQEADYVEGGAFPAASHEATMDRGAMRDQEIDREIARAAKAPRGEAGPSFPALAGLLGKALTIQGDALNGYRIEPVNITPITSPVSTDQWASVDEWLTAAQITAVRSYDASEDVTTALQTAIDESFANQRNLWLPPGRYNISSTLLYPGKSDDRNQGWRMMGAGAGELFARAFTKGTIIAGNFDGSLFKTVPTSIAVGVGSFDIQRIRFEQLHTTTTAPVIHLESAYHAYFMFNEVFQNGRGKGILCDFGVTGAIQHNYVLSGRWASTSDPDDVVSTGIHYRMGRDGGLMLIANNTSRGFEWAYELGDDDAPYNLKVLSCAFRDNESSYCKNGLWIHASCDQTNVENFYLEGSLKGGIGIKNQGRWTKVDGAIIFPGYSKLIEHRGSGGAEFANIVASIGRNDSGPVGAGTNPIAFDIQDNNDGVRISGEAIVDNDTAGAVPNAIMVKVSGTNPRIDMGSLSFNPAGVLPATQKRVDVSGVTGTLRGIIMGNEGGAGQPIFTGALALTGTDTLTQANVTTNTLNLPDGSYFRLLPTEAVTINNIAPTGLYLGRFVIIQINANVTIQDSAIVALTGNRNFSGDGGVIVLHNVGTASSSWREIARYSADGIASAAKIAAVADLAGGADLATTVAKVNELLAAMRTSGSLTT